MQIGIKCNIKNFTHEASDLHVMWISEHFIHFKQRDSFDVVKTPDDSSLQPKHAVRRGSKREIAALLTEYIVHENNNFII
jgi:hypothetical protein